MLIDLHTHTRRFSWDSELEASELIEEAKRRGLDGICLTEHDFFWDVAEAAELARRHNFLVLPGVEINTEDGHVLCFGLTGYVFGMHRAAELAEHVRRAGGVMVAAHPYRRNLPADEQDEAGRQRALDRLRLNAMICGCVAIERINGRGSARENAFATEVSELLQAPSVAGSDAHRLSDIGRCATEFEDKIEDLDGLIRALRAGRCRGVWLA